MSWNYYLEEKLQFPFKARCVALRAISPLKKGEEVEVVGMAKEGDCMHEMFMLIRFAGRKLGVRFALGFACHFGLGLFVPAPDA